MSSRGAGAPCLASGHLDGDGVTIRFSASAQFTNLGGDRRLSPALSEDERAPLVIGPLQGKEFGSNSW